MNLSRGLFDKPDETAQADADARARADMAAGRVVANADVIGWLKKVGSTEETPMPTEWLN